jgi:hypothetical protein
MGPAVSGYLQEVLASNSSWCNGIVPADQAAVKYAEDNVDGVILKPPVQACMLLQHVPGAQFMLRGGLWYMLVFTDGSVKMQGHQWLTHGGWGLYVAPHALANDYGPLENGPYSSSS